MTTMRRTFVALLAGATFLIGASSPAAADPRTAHGPFVEVFDDVDPCTGTMHEVRISTLFLAHEHGDQIVAKGISTLSTSLGYVGRGTSSFVLNANIERTAFTDMLASPSGARIRAHGVFVFDLRSDTVRVDRFTLTCVRS